MKHFSERARFGAARIAIVVGIATALCCIVPSTADTVVIGNINGEIFSRGENNIGGEVVSYVNFAIPITALAAGLEQDVAIGLDFSGGDNAYIRKAYDLIPPVTSVATGNAIKSMASRPDGHFVIGDVSGAVFVRNRSNLLLTAPGYVGADGFNFGGGGALVATTPQGEIVVSNTTGGQVFVRQGSDLTAVPGGFSGDGIDFGEEITALATLSTGDVVIGTASGKVYVRNRTNLNSTPPGYAGSDGISFGAAITALTAASEDNIVIGTSAGRVYLRRGNDLTATPSGYVGDGVDFGEEITALAVTSNDNVAIGRASGWVSVRNAADLTVDVSAATLFNARVTALASTPETASGSWRQAQYQATLQNGSLQARFQAGQLYELRDLAFGDLLVSKDPNDLDSILPLFGQTSVSLDSATVSQTVEADSVHTTFSWADGTSWEITWSLDGGDLVLQTSAQSPFAVDGFYVILTGCDIAAHTLVAVDSYGTAHEMRAPYTGSVFGGNQKNAMPWTLVQPLVVLFEGAGRGWVLEGRDPNIGPSNIRPFGEGQTADLVISRAFPETLATQTPQLFEVRLRVYNGAWQDAVDPHIAWMENDLGFVPIEQKTHTWIQNIRTQAYVTITDYNGLNALAARVDPSKTYLGRQAEYRYYKFDDGFPDYSVVPASASWIGYARSLGFHVGVHTNISGIDRDNTALIQQMEPGLLQVGTDPNGEPIWDGTTTHVRCSPAYPPWRAHFINAIADVVAAGADVIYLDESGPNGKFVIDGVTATQGVMIMEQEIMAAYPGVVLQTEGFNPCTARYAYFALAQHPLGHPLSGYIFSHFIRIVPEGYLYSPTDLLHLDAFMRWGFMLPGSDTSRSESWQQIIDVFQQFDLVADSRLPRNANQLSGFQSATGQAIAYFEKTPTTRSLVVYQPGQDPVSYGVRHTNITQWSGPGYIQNWLIFNGETMMGLDPNQTYWFDPNVTLDPNGFHVTSVPADYLPYADDDRRIISQELGVNDSTYRIFFSGNGQMEVFVPDEYDLYLNAQKVQVDRVTDTAAITVAATQQNPSILRAFKRSEQVLQGKWADLAWQTPSHMTAMVTTLYTLYPPDGFYTAVSGTGFLVGKFPTAESIHLVGSYGMRDDAYNSRGDGVIRINGTEVLRVDPGQGPPYDLIPFDVDVTSFAGQYVLIEFVSDGGLHGPDAADWVAPEIVVSGIYPGTCAEAIQQGYSVAGDFNGDCYVNWADFTIFAADWLRCVDPDDPNCEQPWR